MTEEELKQGLLFEAIEMNVVLYARAIDIHMVPPLKSNEVALVVAHKSSPLYDEIKDARGVFEISEDCLATLVEKAAALALHNRVAVDPSGEVFPYGDEAPTFPTGYVGTVVGVGRNVRSGIVPLGGMAKA